MGMYVEAKTEVEPVAGGSAMDIGLIPQLDL
jgi:hypothetical protein